jgi:hypothetical protein
MTNFENTQTVLHENTEKESDKHPDFKGKMTLFGAEHKASAWLKNNRKNEPCIGLCLSTSNDKNRDVNVTLWQKDNRASKADPHFKAKATIEDVSLTFSAWVRFEGDQGTLRIEVTRTGDQLSDAAMQPRSRLQAFVKEADENLTTPPEANTLLTHRDPDNVDDIPF